MVAPQTSWCCAMFSGMQLYRRRALLCHSSLVILMPFRWSGTTWRKTPELQASASCCYTEGFSSPRVVRKPCSWPSLSGFARTPTSLAVSRWTWFSNTTSSWIIVSTRCHVAAFDVVYTVFAVATGLQMAMPPHLMLCDCHTTLLLPQVPDIPEH